jgi:hypothetical protein
MRRVFVPAAVLAALAVAPSASARVIELGAGATPSARPSCPRGPQDCEAVGRVTGYMGRSGAIRNPFIVPHAGKLVAFTIALGNPTSAEKSFFTSSFGGPPQVRVSVLRAGKTRRTRLKHRLLRQSRIFRVDHYFGSTPTFVFDRPLKVSRKNRVALTVPTWAPALALGVGRGNWWRASRRKGQCSNVSHHAEMETPGRIRTFGCRYSTARLTYTVTYVPDPKRTN